jgi:excisionase family DNA binding protein
MNYVSTREAARQLGLKHDANVRRLIIDGELKARKVAGVWLIDEQDLREFVKTRVDGRRKQA